MVDVMVTSTEQRTQKRVTVMEERWREERTLQQRLPQRQREVDDDWFVLLDAAPKELGTPPSLHSPIPLLFLLILAAD